MKDNSPTPPIDLDSSIFIPSVDGICLVFSCVLHRDVVIVFPTEAARDFGHKTYLDALSRVPTIYKYHHKVKLYGKSVITLARETNTEDRHVSRIFFLHEAEINRARGVRFDLAYITSFDDYKDRNGVKNVLMECLFTQGRVTGLLIDENSIPTHD